MQYATELSRYMKMHLSIFQDNLNWNCNAKKNSNQTRNDVLKTEHCKNNKTMQIIADSQNKKQENVVSTNYRNKTYDATSELDKLSKHKKKYVLILQLEVFLSLVFSFFLVPLFNKLQRATVNRKLVSARK